ncbi:hypothetical protein ACTVJH_04280 [Desulfoplanes sp. PS50]|jgi:hypothetical protein
MDVIIIVTLIVALVSVWGLGYTFISARNNLGRHEAWHTKKKQEMDVKLQALQDKQDFYKTEIQKLTPS